MSKNNDLASIINYLKNTSINIDFKEFEFQVESHPDYPSLLAFSDALTFFNVENAAIKILFPIREELPNNFLAYLKTDRSEELSFIKVSENNLLKNGSQIKWKDLEKQWGGTIFLANQESFKIEVNEYRANNWKWIALVISLLFIVPFFSEAKFENFIFLFFSISGLIISTEIIKQTLGIDSFISEKLCSNIKNSDCESVITSNKWSVLKKVSLSDLSIVFFLGQFFSLVAMSISNYESTFFYIQNIILWGSIPISFFSLYYQWKIVKEWCPLCLLLILVLYGELTCSQIYFDVFSYSLYGLYLFFGINLFILALWLFIKSILISNKSLKEDKLVGLRFKRNYNLFKTILKRDEVLKTPSFNHTFVLGNENANLKISMVTSPFCSYCKDAHVLLESILDKHYNDVAIHIRLNYDASYGSEHMRSKLQNGLAQLYFNKGQNEFRKALKAWFETKDIEQWKRSFNVEIELEKTESFLNEQFAWCKKNDLLFTPTLIINNYQYPKIYDREDLIFFMSDLVEEIRTDKF